MSQAAHSAPELQGLVRVLLARRPAVGTYIIGLTGAVASGKSTLAGTLVRAFRAAGVGEPIEQAGTDGFLHPNAVLTDRGIFDRKGFPESYDRAAMAAALDQVRVGPAAFPGYSHRIYDIDPALARTLERPSILLLEGLGLDRAAPVDTLIYLHAEESDLHVWYADRFVGLWREDRSDPASFYARFAQLDEPAVRDLAAMVWRTINGPNLTLHIAPVREQADIVVVKGGDHAIREVRIAAAL